MDTIHSQPSEDNHCAQQSDMLVMMRSSIRTADSLPPPTTDACTFGRGHFPNQRYTLSTAIFSPKL